MKRAKGSAGALKGKLLWPTFGKGWQRRVDDVRAFSLHLSGRPTPEKPAIIEKEVTVEVPVPVPVEKPVVPESVEQKVKEKSNWLTWLTGGGGLSTIGLGWLAGMDWQAVLAGGVVLVVVILVLVLLRSQIIAAVRDIKAEVGS